MLPGFTPKSLPDPGSNEAELAVTENDRFGSGCRPCAPGKAVIHDEFPKDVSNGQ